MKKLASAIALLVTMSVSVSASAEDAKTYPGGMCQPQTDFDATDLSRYSGITNYHASQVRRVKCPIVRDNTGNTNGTKGVLVYVWRGYPAKQNFYCSLISRNIQGYTVASDSRSHTGTGLGTLSLDVDTSVYRGNYELYCEIPNSSTLYSYVVREH